MIDPGNIPFNTDSFGGDGFGAFSRMNERRPLSDVDVYVRDGFVAGVRVDDEYRDRQIPQDTDLSTIFTPVPDVSVYCLSLCPGSADIELYQSILQEVASGDAILESQDKHPTEHGFVVLLTVNRARMVFRKSSYNEDFPKICEVK